MHPDRNSEVVLKVKIGNFPMSYYLVPPLLFLPLGIERTRGLSVRTAVHPARPCRCLAWSSPVACFLNQESSPTPLFSLRAAHSLQLAFKAI